MIIILIIAALLVGAAAIVSGYIIFRASLRAYMARRLIQQANEVKQKLKKLREVNSQEGDKLLIELRDTYDVRAIEDELRHNLENRAEDGAELARAFGLLGLTDRYLGHLESSKSWRERARAATALGALGEVRAVPLLLARMRDPREDDDVKLVCAEALGRIRDPSVIPTLAQELGSVDEWASPRLAQVLTSFGKLAVSPLLVTLQTSNNLNASIWAAQVLGKLADTRAVTPLLARLHDRSERMRMSAAIALGDLQDRRALQPLIDVILRDPIAAVRAQAASALGRIGDSEALPLLVIALGDPEYWMRFRALEAIEVLKPEDPTPLEAALNDPNAEVRRRAAFALDRLGFLEQHFEALESTDPEIAFGGREQLILVGRAGLSERLIRQIDADKPSVRAHIATILGAVGAPEHTTSLVGLLGDAELKVKCAAIRALGDLRTHGTAFHLVPHLSHNDPAVRDAAVDALMKYPGEELESLRGQIISLLHEESDEIRVGAARVLAVVPNESVDKALIGALKQRYVEVRFHAAQALAARRCVAAVDALAECLDDVSPKTRLAATDALGSLGTDGAVQHLLNAIGKADTAMRDSICNTLAGRGFDMIQPALDVMLASEEVEARLGAIWTLGKTRDARAVGLLRLLLEEADERLRSSAAGALGKIENSEPARHALVKSCKDPSPRVRAASVNALGRIGDDSVISVLIATLNDPDSFVRNRALIATGRLGGEDATDALLGEELADTALDPAFRAIGLALCGAPGAVAEAVSVIKDRTIRSRVEAILAREEPQVAERFYENIQLGQKRGEGGDDERLDPTQLISHYAHVMRTSPDPEARRQAAGALSRLDDATALEAVGDAIRYDPEPDVRHVAVEALAKHAAHPLAKESLLLAATDPIPRVRTSAIRLLGEAVRPEEATVLLSALRSRHRPVRDAAEEAVAAVFAGSIQRFHDWMMGNDDDQVRRAGLRVLARLGQAESIGLVGVLLRSSSPDVRIEAGRALASMNAWGATDTLFGAITDPIESVRVGIVRSLALTGRQEVAERLGEISIDPSPQVRSALAETAGALPFAASVALLARLAEDAVPEVAGKSFLSLMRHKQPDATSEALMKWEGAPEEVRLWVRHNCDDAVASLAERMANDLEAPRREEACRMLIALDTRRYANVIAEALKDPDAAVRLAAVHGLGTLDVNLVADWIRALLTDPVKEVRTAAQKILFRAV